MTTEPTKEQLNSFVLQNHGSFQQSWQWGELQEKMGRAVRRFLFTDGGLKTSVTGSATFVRHDLKFGKYYWLCPKGPVITPHLTSPTRGEELIQGLLRFARNDKNCIFVRIEPAYKLQANSYKLVKAPKDHNPRATILINLSRSEAELMAMMHPKTRYNLRLAQKKELKFKEWIPASAGMGEMWGLLEKTASRDKFFLHSEEYYEKLTEMPEIKMLGVHHDDELIAAAMISFWGDTATYLHGASSYEHRALMAPYLLQWQAIGQAKTAGLHYYDFGGVAPSFAKASEGTPHSLAGVTRFKSGWGGEYVEYAGSWDFVLDKKWYWIYRLARKVM